MKKFLKKNEKNGNQSAPSISQTVVQTKINAANTLEIPTGVQIFDSSDSNNTAQKHIPKYKPKWEDKLTWLESINGQAFCKICKKSLMNNLGNLKRHGSFSIKHQKKLKSKEMLQLDVSCKPSIKKRQLSKVAHKYNWTVRITRILIREYKKYESLYNTRHPDYKNRSIRLDVYRKILNVLNIKQKGLEIKELMRKLNGLKRQYLNEKLKITRSRKSGINGEPVYEPKIYWYPILKFLDAYTEADTSISIMDDTLNNLKEESSLCIDSILEDAVDSTQGSSNMHQAEMTVIREKQQPRQTEKYNGYDSILTNATRTMSEMAKIETSPVKSDINSILEDAVGSIQVTSNMHQCQRTQNRERPLFQGRQIEKRKISDGYDSIQTNATTTTMSEMVRIATSSVKPVREDDDGSTQVSCSNMHHTEMTQNCERQPRREKNKISDGYDLNIGSNATMPMNEMARIATSSVKPDDEFSTFGKFVGNEMRAMREASDVIAYRQVKKKIQLVLLNHWDSIDCTLRASTRASIVSSSIKSFNDNSQFGNIIDEGNFDSIDNSL